MTSYRTATTIPCSTGYLKGFVHYFAVAILAGIIVIIFLLPKVQDWLFQELPSFKTRLLVQFIIIVTIIYVCNRLVLNYELMNPYCGDYILVDS